MNDALHLLGAQSNDPASARQLQLRVELNPPSADSTAKSWLIRAV
jgi:hypothetical protein